MTFTNEQKRKAAEREVSMRKVVYPGQIKRGAVQPAAAEFQIAIMQEIADDYRKLEEADASQGS